MKVEQICENCKYWERHKLNPPEETPWGKCNYWNEIKNKTYWCSQFLEENNVRRIKI